MPYDLKVTYLPEGYIKAQRKQRDQKEEMSILRKFCREKKIHFDKTLPAARLLEDLWKKVADHPSEEAKTLIKDLKSCRLAILNTAKERT